MSTVVNHWRIVTVVRRGRGFSFARRQHVRPATRLAGIEGRANCELQGDLLRPLARAVQQVTWVKRSYPGYALLVDFGLDEAGEISQRILPPQIARLHRNDVGKSCLHDVYVGADGDGLERYRHLNFAR